jgi:ATP-dependent DNA helicase RecG
VETTRNAAEKLLTHDMELALPENAPLKNQMLSQKGKTEWSKIS